MLECRIYDSRIQIYEKELELFNVRTYNLLDRISKRLD